MNLPLEGLKVLDLSRLLPGPYCSQLLADYGAEVIKVEDTGMGDYIRWSPPYYDGPEGSARSALFIALNRNKKSIRLNLKSEAGREVLLKLVREADVLLEGFRPGVMDKLGVGYETLRQQNPRLIYCAITGYGQTGPYRDRSGHDLNYLGLAGVLAISGEAGGPPAQSAAQIADIGGGALMAAFGIMAALRERESSGEGQLVDISMTDGALSWLALAAGETFGSGTAPHRGEPLLGGAAICYRPYECSDGWVTLGALEPKFWAAWCVGVDREELIQNQFDRPGTDAHREVEAIFKERTRSQWQEFAAANDCCLEPVLELDEALNSDLMRQREMVLDVKQPGAQGSTKALATGVKLSRTPGTARTPAPALGADTESVLAELGYSASEIASLVESGAAGSQTDSPRTPFLG